jgi:hypothetical protein
MTEDDEHAYLLELVAFQIWRALEDGVPRDPIYLSAKLGIRPSTIERALPIQAELAERFGNDS